MRSRFNGFYRPSKEDFKTLWNTAIFVPDASVLLNLYRYSESGRSGVLEVLQEVHARLWIPHQVGLEFHKNRDEVITEQAKKHKEMEDNLVEVVQELQSKRSHPHVSAESIKCLSAVINELQQGSRKTLDLLTDDFVLSAVSELFTDEKVGPLYGSDVYEQTCKVAEDRYARGIPPGFKDESKGKPAAFGDYIVWRQVMDQARDSKTPVLFITDDHKEDWWRVKHGRTLGPRPELIEEFLTETGQLFYMYKPDSFMNWAKQNLKLGIQDEVIKELSEYHKNAPLDLTLVDRKLSMAAEELRLHQELALLRQRLVERTELRKFLSARHHQIVEEESGSSSPERHRELLTHLAELSSQNRSLETELTGIYSAIETVERELREVHNRSKGAHLGMSIGGGGGGFGVGFDAGFSRGGGSGIGGFSVPPIGPSTK